MDKMLKTAAFVLGFALTFMIAEPLGEPRPFRYDLYFMKRVLPNAVAQTFSATSAMIFIVAFAGAGALIIAVIAMQAGRKPFAFRLIMCGGLVGLCISACMDAWCVHVMRTAGMQPNDSPPGYYFCVFCLAAAAAGFAVMIYLDYNAREIARIPPGGFNLDEMGEMYREGKLTRAEYLECRTAVEKAKLAKRVELAKKNSRR